MLQVATLPQGHTDLYQLAWCACLWTAWWRWSTWREPTQTRGEHANSTENGPGWGQIKCLGRGTEPVTSLSQLSTCGSLSMLWSVLVWYVNRLWGQGSPIKSEGFLKAVSFFALGKAVPSCKINRAINISKDEKCASCSHVLNTVGLIELCWSVGWLDTWSAPKIRTGAFLNIAPFFS